MRKTLTALSFVTAFAASLSAGPSVADTEFEDSIPIDLARILLRGAGNAMDVKIYSDIPDSFPTFDLPNDVTLMGSVDQGHNQQVVLYSDGDGEHALTALIESLQTGGYLLIDRTPANRQQVGFVSANPQNLGIPAQLCHDTRGLIYIRLHPEANRAFINITATANTSRGGYTCADQAAQRASPGGTPAFFSGARGLPTLQSSIPRLVFPEDAATSRPNYMPVFGSSSRDHAESKTEFSIDWSLTEVQEFFSQQIVAQEWELDSESAGDRIAFSAWTKEDNDRLLLGTLQLVSKGENRYQAVFSVSLLE